MGLTEHGAAKRRAYRAFLSYSHAADGRLAPALQGALQGFARPWHRLRTLRVFRDKSSLSANPGLWPTIEEALEESEWFLLLASPQSAASPWVAREVAWWLEHRSVRTLLILLTDGHVVWDPESSDFDWSRSDALPANLRGHFSQEPLYVDLRWARTADRLSLRHSRFHAAVLDVVAPLLDRPKEDLDGEDVRQYRRNRRVALAAIASITLFGVVAVLGQMRLRRANDRLELDLQTMQLQKARTFGQQVAVYMNGVQGSVTALARSLDGSPVPDSVAHVRRTHSLEGLLDLPGSCFRHLFLLDERGVGFAAGSVLLDSDIRSHLKAVRDAVGQRGETVLGDTFFLESHGEMAVVLGEPLRSPGGDPQGAVLAIASLRVLCSMAEGLADVEHIYVVDERGSLLADSDPGRLLADRDVAHEALVAAFIRDGGLTATVQPFSVQRGGDSVDSLGTFARVPGYEWGVLVELEGRGQQLQVFP